MNYCVIKIFIIHKAFLIMTPSNCMHRMEFHNTGLNRYQQMFYSRGEKEYEGRLHGFCAKSEKIIEEILAKNVKYFHQQALTP